MGAREIIYPELRFGGFTRRDGTLLFYARVNALLPANARVLDYGCGVGAHASLLPPFVKGLQVLRGRVAEVIGTDVDYAGATNPYIDRFLPLGAGFRIPLDADAVDLVVCDWGLEHFEEPATFFADVHRVLKPGGHLCLRTPNLLHYSSLGARAIPFRFHHAVRRALGHFHSADDVFPTYYRCNTQGQLERALGRAGFDPCVIRHRGESHTARAGVAVGWVGELIERWSPMAFAHELHAFARKR
jgi:SAM-dependent methyltransferase